MVKEKVLPENLEQFWSVPSIVAEDGMEHKFSYYYVHSETGDLWTCYFGRYKRPGWDQNGYRLTGLQSDDGYILNTTMQRVVLSAKLQSWDFDEAHHKNQIRDDNRPTNIEERSRNGQFDEVTRENQSKAKRGEKSHTAVLTVQDVQEIRSGSLGQKLKDYKVQMAEKYNVHPQTIYAIIKGYTWTYLDKEDSYVE